jgi:hypothetical protein
LLDIKLPGFEEMAQESLEDEREEFALQIREDRNIELREREPGGDPRRHGSLELVWVLKPSM